MPDRSRPASAGSARAFLEWLIGKCSGRRGAPVILVGTAAGTKFRCSRWRVNRGRAMSGAKPYDLVVIGAGAAGEAGAVNAAIFGAKVAVVEKNAVVGGAAANTGTLPSKTLRETALA